MAGDWIKMRGNLWDDPRVARLVDMTDSSEAAIVGSLYWLWATADQHTHDGAMPGLTLRAIDRKTGVPGFAAALCAVGWLEDHPEGVRIVNFEEHNGASAKSRVQTAKRVSNHKANAKVTHTPLPEQQGAVSTALPREEKRREEKREDKPPAGVTRATRKCPESFEITESMSSWATENAPSVDAFKATDKFRDHTFKTAISDWPGAWRNWIRRDQEDAAKRGPINKQQALEDRNREVGRQWAEEQRARA